MQCPKRKADIKARKAAVKKTLAGKTPLPLTVKNVPTTAAEGRICSQKAVLVDVSDETKTFWKYYTPGPATYSREWEEIYRPLRAMIESKNGVLKWSLSAWGSEPRGTCVPARPSFCLSALPRL